jgi:hypothetical protein
MAAKWLLMMIMVVTVIPRWLEVAGKIGYGG